MYFRGGETAQIWRKGSGEMDGWMRGHCDFALIDDDKKSIEEGGGESSYHVPIYVK